MVTKKESSLRNMVLTLLLVPGIASLALGGVYVLTKDRIEQAKQRKLQNAISLVLPEFDSLAIASRMPDSGKDSLFFYHAFKEDSLIGTAVKSYTDIGFSGRFTIMVGFLTDGYIYDAMVLEHKETPGLGDKMEKKKSPFTDQFKRMKPLTSTLKVKKDGGTVDAITAATISSRAFCDAVSRANDEYTKKGGEK